MFRYLKISDRNQNKELIVNRILRISPLFDALSIVISVLCCIASVEAASNADWQAMASYEYGHDMKPLLLVDAEVTEAINDPQTRKALATRMAALLEDDKTTLAAKQFICLKLQKAGTPAEVPVLAAMLDESETARWPAWRWKKYAVKNHSLYCERVCKNTAAVNLSA